MNLVIVRMSDHTTEWFFDAKNRIVARGNLMVLGLAPGNARMLAYYQPDQWVGVETRKIDPETWTDEDDCALLVEAWVYHERKLHAESKYGRGSAPRRALMSDTALVPKLGAESAWYTFITNYLSRAGNYGVNLAAGAQAAAKLTTTVTHHLETVQLVWSSLPEPGDTTNGCQPWYAPAALREAREAAGIKG